jgi:hypothetical protein
LPALLCALARDIGDDQGDLQAEIVRARAPAAYPPYECRLPAGPTERDNIGIGTPGAFPLLAVQV